MDELINKKDKQTYIMHSVKEDEFDVDDIYRSNDDLVAVADGGAQF